MKPTEANYASFRVKPFYPALDGLRGIAILAVFLVHFMPMIGAETFFRWGWVGVDLFFVLSGFLITGILYDSIDELHYFRTFYIRRTLRIFPLYYAVWLLFVVATPFLHFQWNRYVLAHALYVGNYFVYGNYLQQHPDPSIIYYQSVRHPGVLAGIYLGHFWSLAVEEQFYLVWPLVVWLVRSRVLLLRICLLVILSAPVARFAAILLYPQLRESGAIYVLPPLRIDSLLIGAAVALWLRGNPLPFSKLRIRAIITGLAASVSCMALYSIEPMHAAVLGNDYAVSIFGFTLVGITAACILILALDSSSSFARALTARPLARLGRLSYGFYVIHILLWSAFANNVILFRKHNVVFLIPVLAFIITFVLAEFSFRFLESPFLKFKDFLAPVRDHVSDPSPRGESVTG